MIRKVFAQNYRSIAALTLDLTGFDCFVGPNNSGKSNLFDVFAFLAETAKSGLQSAIGSRGYEKLRYYAASGPEPTIVELVMTLPSLPQYSQIDFTLGFDPRTGVLEREIVNVFKGSGKATTLISQNRVEGQGLTTRILRGTVVMSTGGFEQSALFGFPDVYGDVTAVIRGLKEYFLRFRNYKFAPDRVKVEGPATHEARLAPDGSNFASYLHTVHSENRRHFNRIEEELKKSFPSVEELVTPLSPGAQGYTEVGIKEKWFPKSAAGTQLSDGLAGFLAYLAVLYGPEEPSLVVFEEPENHIHPRLMERLVEMLRGASRDQQILLSSHSVPLINRLSLKELVLVERGQDGGTTARRVKERAELEAALKDWALGEAYASGVLDAA